MSNRHILVIASQCDAYAPVLSSLDTAARSFYEVMVDPRRGDCSSGLEEEEGLLIDPSVSDTKNAIREAFEAAAKDTGQLVLAFLGHGVVTDTPSKFYFLPKDAVAGSPDSDHAISLVEQISEQWGNNPKVDGLVVLVDSCSSGNVAISAAEQWVPYKRSRDRVNFELLAAAAPDQLAFDACFTRTLAEFISRGDPGAPTSLLDCAWAHRALAMQCMRQEPQHLKFGSDERLFLARNVATPDYRWGQAAPIIYDHLQYRQPTGDLEKVAEQSRDRQCVAYVGRPGSGRSSLAAALTTIKGPPSDGATLFVHAIAFPRQFMDMASLAEELAKQLETTLGAPFRTATQDFARATPDAKEGELSAFGRRLFGPLRRLQTRGKVRIVLDGLDLLQTKARAELRALINEVLQDNSLGFVRLVVTASNEEFLPRDAVVVRAPAAANRADIEAYLRRYGCLEADVPLIADYAQGNWLIARYLGDKALESPGGIGAMAAPCSLEDVYEHMLREAALGDAPSGRVEPKSLILSILAAGGRGPLMPICLLCAASAGQRGPDNLDDVRFYLHQLTDLVVCLGAGTDEEHVGLFHPTLVTYIEQGKYGELVGRCREAIVGILAEKATAVDAVKQYAVEREAGLLLALKQPDQALESLRRWDGEIRSPGENMNRWNAWKETFAEKLSEDDPFTLAVRSELAERKGKCGREMEAWRELKDVLVLQRKRFGNVLAREALKTRHYLTHWIGPIEGPKAALEQARELLPDEMNVLGKNARDVFKTRHNIAYWESRAGDRRTALSSLNELLRDEAHAKDGLGPNDPDTLRTRHLVAFLTGQCGDPGKALRLFEELLPDEETSLGKEHIETLRTRDNIANWTGHSGEPGKAKWLYERLLEDREQRLGSTHPDTLRNRRFIAFWKGRSGRPVEALHDCLELLKDLDLYLGPTHDDTLKTLELIALWTGLTGNASEALPLAAGTLRCWQQKSGQQPDAFFVRHLIATLHMACGNSKKAMDQANELLTEMSEILGERHPDTMLLRHNIARWVGQTGDPPGAVKLLEALAADREQVLGADHLGTLETRYNVVFWQMECDDGSGNGPNLDEIRTNLDNLRNRMMKQEASFNLNPKAPSSLRLRTVQEYLDRFTSVSER